VIVISPQGRWKVWVSGLHMRGYISKNRRDSSNKKMKIR